MSGNKISFGFSKIKKKPSSFPTKAGEQASDIQYITSIEDRTLKLSKPELKEDKKVLIIPLERNEISKNNGKITKEETVEAGIKSPNHTGSSDSSLEALAIKELLTGVEDTNGQKCDPTLAVPLASNPPLGKKEPTLEDYEDIPVTEFGMAMLRGMGWAPGKGIGKNGGVAQDYEPKLRPKGLGLGADTAMKNKTSSSCNNTTEQHVLPCKGSFIRIIKGNNKGRYGQVEGFCDETGRVIVKLSLGNTVITVNELMLEVISKEEYSKNNKVINITKYDKYKTYNK